MDNYLLPAADTASSNMASDLPFERYDAEFLSLTSQVQSSLASLQSAGDPQSELNFCKNLLSQCDDLLKQMSVEARSASDAGTKQDLLKKVRVCKTRLANLRDDYNSSKTNLERDSLLGGNGSDNNNNNGKLDSNGHRERLLQAGENLSAQNDTLENARRVMAETEDVALEITSELGRNREKIQSATGRVRDVSGLTNQARRIVQSMSRREVQQKLAMYVISFLIIVTFLVLMYRMT